MLEFSFKLICFQKFLHEYVQGRQRKENEAGSNSVVSLQGASQVVPLQGHPRNEAGPNSLVSPQGASQVVPLQGRPRNADGSNLVVSPQGASQVVPLQGQPRRAGTTRTVLKEIRGVLQEVEEVDQPAEPQQSARTGGWSSFANILRSSIQRKSAPTPLQHPTGPMQKAQTPAALPPLQTGEVCWAGTPGVPIQVEKAKPQHEGIDAWAASAAVMRDQEPEENSEDEEAYRLQPKTMRAKQCLYCGEWSKGTTLGQCEHCGRRNRKWPGEKLYNKQLKEAKEKSKVNQQKMEQAKRAKIQTKLHKKYGIVMIPQAQKTLMPQ